MRDRKTTIEETRVRIGWVYDEMNWMSDKIAERESRSLRLRLRNIIKSANLSFKGNKVHIGALSPGCQCCGAGTWSCIYLTMKCTANCYFCPQHIQIEGPYSDSLIFKSAHDYADYIEAMGYRGISFSGGDPMVEYDQLLHYVRTIKRRFGRNVYVWLYTNGRLVTERKMEELSIAGLDEVRFNIAANDYILDPLITTKKHIRTATVEIPALPGDEEKVVRLMPRLEKAGVAYLNLHEVLVSKNNYRNLMDRGYTFVHKSDVSILESEQAALTILEESIKRYSEFPINYCTHNYKNRIQIPRMRHRIASMSVRPYESVTEAGYIRQLLVIAEKNILCCIERDLSRKYRNPKRFKRDENQNALIVHHSVLDDIKVNSRRVTCSIIYYRPKCFGWYKVSACAKVPRRTRRIKPEIKKMCVERIDGLSLRNLKNIRSVFTNGSEYTASGRPAVISPIKGVEIYRQKIGAYEDVESDDYEVF